MLTPVGPHAPAVYWRRRLATLAVLAIAVTFIVSVSMAIFGQDPSGAGATKPAAATSSAAASQPGAAQATGEPTAGQATGESKAAPGGAVASTATPPEQPPAEATTPPAESPTPTPPPAPPICDNSQIEVQAAVATDPIRVGDKPKLILSVVNRAPNDCIRDLNAAGQELLIYGADGARLWSSNDCYPEASNDTRLMTPEQKVDFTVVWSGKSSAPGCTVPRKVLGAGNYLLEANQGGVVSARVPLNIQP